MGKLAKEPSKLSHERDPVGVVGLPRLASKPRTSSLVVGSSDEQQHEVEREFIQGKKRERVDWFFDNCVYWTPQSAVAFIFIRYGCP